MESASNFNFNEILREKFFGDSLPTPKYIEMKLYKIFKRKRLSTAANCVYVYIEIWDKGILKFNKSVTGKIEPTM